MPVFLGKSFSKGRGGECPNDGGKERGKEGKYHL